MNQETNEPASTSPVGVQTPPQREESVMCPKCDEVIFIEQDTRPDGKIVCDACKGRFTNYEALMKAVEKKRPPAPPAPVVAQAIAVARIDPNPEQPRQDFDEAKLKELADSIVANGLIQPITVEPVGDRFMLHDGERRWRAHLLAGLAEIAAYIVAPGTDPKALLLRAIVANDQRADLSPIERARGYQRLADEHGLSDSQIATQVGKSRSVVANTRRLLGLPEAQQKQLAAGELNERQALALLPLYALPAEVQGKVLNNWEGKKLANPKGLTSDQIRSSLNAGVRSQGQEISLFEADQVFEGAGVHHPTCTGCDLYVKVGQQTICLNKTCLETKQAQVMATYLEQAGAATGLPYLNPTVELKYNQSDDFSGASEVQALELALTNHCPNLRLEYRRRSWDYGEGPKDFDRCRYACLHNGEGCACAGQLKATKEAESKAKKEAIGQLKCEAINHVAKLITDNHPSLLRAILNTMLNNYYGGADMTAKLKPGQIVRKLAEQLVDRNAHVNEYRSIEENRLDITKWLDKVGLPPLSTTAPDPVADLNLRLVRLAEWVHRLIKTIPTIDQVCGNLSNLAKLANEAQQLQDAGSDQDRAQLAEKKILSSIDGFKSILLAIQPIVESQVDQVEIEHVSWILTVPSGDGNFKDHLAHVNHTATIDYILALIPLFAQGKTAREAIERRRRKLEAPPTDPATVEMLAEVARIKTKLAEITAWLSKTDDHTDKKLLNRHEAAGELGADVYQLVYKHGQTEELTALLAEIEDVEARCMARRRELNAPTAPAEESKTEPVYKPLFTHETTPCPRCGELKVVISEFRSKGKTWNVECHNCYAQWTTVEEFQAEAAPTPQTPAATTPEVRIDPTGQLIEVAGKICGAESLTRDFILGVMEIEGKTYTCTGYSGDWAKLVEVVPLLEHPGPTRLYTEICRDKVFSYAGQRVLLKKQGRADGEKGRAWVLTGRELTLRRGVNGSGAPVDETELEPEEVTA